MSSKQVAHYAKIQDKIASAIDKINDPIRQTLSPRGSNVIYEDNKGAYHVTNDGATIIKNLTFKDPYENGILDIVKHASLKTNNEAGDGTSTTVILSSLFIKEGLRLVGGGRNAMDVKHAFDDFATQMVESLKKSANKIKNDKDLFYIANVSASGEREIADNVVKTIKIAGEDGMVFIEPSNTTESEIIEDTGFNIKAGMFLPELRNNERNLNATYLDIPVLITDKRLYYAQEAETILNTCLKNGYKEVVIVAKDFIGEALPLFVTNHTRGSIRVLLIKEPSVDKNNGIVLEDLAIYLGGTVVSDKNGSLVDKLTMDDFVLAKRVLADGQKTIISRDKNEKNAALVSRISALKKEVKKFGTEEKQELFDLKERLASLTNGMVTIRVGGNTAVEVNEKIFRYEDAINATRMAIRHGYIVGGGLGMFQAFRDCDFPTKDREMFDIFRKIAEANIRQIATNCGISPDLVIDNVLAMPRNYDNLVIGYNASSQQYDNLLECGVIEPLRVAEMAIRNAASVAGMIVSSGYYIVNEEEDGESKK